jgi:hypothetical protein
MSNPYTLYNSYGYKSPVPLSAPRMTRYPNGYPYSKTATGSSGEVSKTVVNITLIVLAVLILGWLGLNFFLYEKDEAWFKVYKAPPPPANSIQPNGDGTGGKLDPAVTTFKNSQLAGYQALKPSTTPSEFGGYITTPPLP